MLLHVSVIAARFPFFYIVTLNQCLLLYVLLLRFLYPNIAIQDSCKWPYVIRFLTGLLQNANAGHGSPYTCLRCCLVPSIFPIVIFLFLVILISYIVTKSIRRYVASAVRRSLCIQYIDIYLSIYVDVCVYIDV